MQQVADLSASARQRAANLELVVFDVDGVLTDGRLYYSDDGREMKAFHVQDGFAIKLLRAHGVEVALISGRHSTMVTRRAEELGIVHLYHGVQDKAAALGELVAATGIDPARIAHVGDDLPDLAIFGLVGLAVSVADGHPAVTAAADHVTAAAGGHGVARELCQVILAAKGRWPY